jgi:hypothetical protein
LSRVCYVSHGANFATLLHWIYSFFVWALSFLTLLLTQAREKYLSLKKGTRADVATAVEDVSLLWPYRESFQISGYFLLLTCLWHYQELHSARSSFEQARFNLVHHNSLISYLNSCCANAFVYLIYFHIQVTALSNIEAKKRFEFLEAVSGTMDAHLRYFKQVQYCAYFHINISIMYIFNSSSFFYLCRDTNYYIRWSHISIKYLFQPWLFHAFCSAIVECFI